MPKEGHVLPESSNKARVSPYPLRSSRTKKDKAPESSNRVRVSPYPLRSSRTNKYKAPEQSPVQSEWEDVRCVICMEPPHNAVLLTCSSSLSGCRPYMCNTSARHSNCFKQFCETNKMKGILECPLCRGEVLKTTKVTDTARIFMNTKPKSCPVDDCEFSGTYSQLNKHVKNVHGGIIPPKVDPQRQMRWEELVRLATNVELMNAAGLIPSIDYVPVLRVNIVDGTVRSIFVRSPLRNESGATDYTASYIPRL